MCNVHFPPWDIGMNQPLGTQTSKRGLEVPLGSEAEEKGLAGAELGY